MYVLLFLKLTCSVLILHEIMLLKSWTSLIIHNFLAPDIIAFELFNGCICYPPCPKFTVLCTRQFSLQNKALKNKLLSASKVNVVLLWTSCMILVWKCATSVCLYWNSKPLVFEVLSRADVLRRSSHFSFISTSILYILFIICI